MQQCAGVSCLEVESRAWQPSWHLLLRKQPRRCWCPPKLGHCSWRLPVVERGVRALASNVDCYICQGAEAGPGVQKHCRLTATYSMCTLAPRAGFAHMFRVVGSRVAAWWAVRYTLWVVHAGVFAEVCPSGVGAVQSAIVNAASADSPAGTSTCFCGLRGHLVAE